MRFSTLRDDGNAILRSQQIRLLAISPLDALPRRQVPQLPLEITTWVSFANIPTFVPVHQLPWGPISRDTDVWYFRLVGPEGVSRGNAPICFVRQKSHLTAKLEREIEERSFHHSGRRSEDATMGVILRVNKPLMKPRAPWDIFITRKYTRGFRGALIQTQFLLDFPLNANGALASATCNLCF
jgi:hypothetical protein